MPGTTLGSITVPYQELYGQDSGTVIEESAGIRLALARLGRLSLVQVPHIFF